MDLDFQAEGFLLIVLFVIAVVVLPIKAGASLAQASRHDLLSCAVASAIGIGAGYLGGWFYADPMIVALITLAGLMFGIRVVVGASIAAATGIGIAALAVAILAVAFVLRMA